MSDSETNAGTLSSSGFNQFLSRVEQGIETLDSGLFGTSNIASLKNQINSRKPLPSDYFRFNQAYFSVGTTTLTIPNAARISVTSIDATKFFQIGDKLHIIQSGVDSYYFVIALTSTYLDINGGINNTLVNTTINTIESSRLGAPSGFIGALRFNPKIAGFSGAYTNPDATDDELTYFTMVGKVPTLYISVTSGKVASNSYVSIVPPVPMDTSYYRGITLIDGPSTGWYESTNPGGVQNIFFYGSLVAPYQFSSVGNTVNFATQLSYNALS